MIDESHSQVVIEDIRRWISSIVVGLNLCPFAGRVFQADRIRYAVTDAEDEEALRADLAGELRTLASAPMATVETTLLIHPRVLADFLAYNDFLGVAERLLGSLGLRETIQIASFHPRYQFAGAGPEAVENYSNRSPYPMLHLLREESIAAVAADPGELAEIPRRNVATLRALGSEKLLEKLKALEGGR
jgi:hypothetical protein